MDARALRETGGRSHRDGGRVHRFGSRQTTLIDTLVVKDSREADAYRVARGKLEQITRTLVDPEKFEALFSRVMCLIPPDEFADLVIDTTGPGLTDEQQRRLAKMVRRGYQSWDDFHRRYAERQRAIRALSPGLATWADLRRLLEEQAGAVAVDGFRSLRFTRSVGDEHPVAIKAPVPVVRLGDGGHYCGQEHDGMPISGPDGVAVRPLGLNVPVVADVLRRLALASTTTGAAQLRWPAGKPPGSCGPTFGLLVLLRQTLRSEESRWVEQGLTLHVYHVDESGA